MDFFQAACQSGPFTQQTFGVCDNQNSTPAYVDTENQQNWVATVENPAQLAVTFTAIDKCVLQDSDERGRGRCDGMLTTDNLLYLVELKEQIPPWQSQAIEQLQSTISFLQEHHDLSPYRHKKAFGCNKKRDAFTVIDHEIRRRFFDDYGFRLDLQGTIKLPGG
ncbi:hypothetical protein GKQ23_10290 [Erwinia sp. E602]|uniref:hypothetical protein n=1 Tax=Erwinia sp. E602 TaxID=2675378 RepID=UPI001BAA27FC|nr:hypothetical protein [Erwinia sp. E602]QUG75348.1 hypothetical protein GKQ23_10290 [Erwinia sp. E602]